jgi:hypothetical protein
MTSPNSLDIEHALVLACAVASGVDDALLVARSAAPDPIDWRRLRAVATAHGLRPAVARTLAAAAASDVSDAQTVLADLALTSRANEGHAKLIAGELLRILHALAAAHISAIPYKGPAFEHAMGAAPGLREMTDLDLFVHPARLASATGVLEPLGYAPALPKHALQYPHFDQVTPEWQLVRQADGLIIELHCRVAPAWFPTLCSLDEIAARQQTLSFAGQRIAWPAPEELLLIHVADGMKSCGRGMKWIGDVARILRRYPELDWPRIADIASRHGGLNVVRVALAMVIDCCAEIAESLDAPEIRLSVAPQAEALAEDARRAPRLTAALAEIRSGIQNDAPLPGAMAHFGWSIRLSDHPLRTTAAVAHYLTGPAIADLAQASAAGSVLPLPARAFLRRLRAVVGLRH